MLDDAHLLAGMPAETGALQKAMFLLRQRGPAESCMPAGSWWPAERWVPPWIRHLQKGMGLRDLQKDMGLMGQGSLQNGL